MQSSIEPKRPVRGRQRALCLALAFALGAAPPAALAQADRLPRLGDAAADDLSPAAERRLGERIMRDLRRDAAVSGDIEIGDYLNRLAATLTVSSPGQSFELFLVSDPSLNAFALPGGFIGIHTGLIMAAETESELASVIAHEIGHVTQRHIARMLSGQRQTTLGTLAAVVLAALAARSNPQAAAGIVTMASGAQQQQMLAFSRDAEREADRVGLDTLREAGFDPNGMVSFFGRLQQSTRTYESSAPAYMRSHPMTVERIADMQARVQEGRYRQHPDSLEFRLARARLRAQGDGSVDALRTERARFERQLRERTTHDATAAWFGVAVAALAQRDFAAAERAIGETRRLLPEGHPFVERLAAQSRLQAGDARGALAVARAAAARFPAARSLVHLQAEAMIALRDHRAAAAFLDEQLALRRSDVVLWRLMARARNGLGETAQAHRASAEAYALEGAWLPAVEQLELARRAGGLDFYSASQLDARIKVLQAEYRREQEDAKAGLR